MISEHILRTRIWAIHRLGGEAEELDEKLWILRRRGHPIVPPSSVYEEHLLAMNATLTFGARDLPTFTDSRVALPTLTTKVPDAEPDA